MKAVAKEKVPMEAHSPRSTFAASRKPGNNEAQILSWNNPNIALYLPLAVSQMAQTVTSRLSTSQQHKSG